ncbi:DNA mismatch repair ATPase msh1 [Mortierella alpina]|nr:DNA mismatch repair ATPase msh1 [Mortierella alpina]
MLAPGRHWPCMKLARSMTRSHLLLPTFLGDFARRARPLLQHVPASRSVDGETIIVSKSSVRQYHAALHPSTPRPSRSKADSNGVQGGLSAEAETMSSRPKLTVLRLEDLEGVNSNPTILSSDDVPGLPMLDTTPKPKRKRVSRAKQSRKDAAGLADPQAEIVTLMPKGIETKATESKKRLTPLRKQILELEATYPDCVLLVRVGEFYELYDHNAVEYGHLLGLKMGSKVFSGQTIPFTGFPIRQLDRHLETLVGRHSLKVALCEQYQDDRETGTRSFRRSVHRIITPGTLIDEQFLDQAENNWLLAVASDKTSHTLGLSWLDLSTGDFFTQETSYESFPNDLARIRPREIILNSNLRDEPEHAVLEAIQRLGQFVVSYEDMRSAAQLALKIENEILSEAEEYYGFDPRHLRPFTNREQSACLAILRYVNHTQMGRRPVVQQPIEWKDNSIMKIDRNTIEALELARTLRDSSRMGSLLYYLDKTKTKAGSRLLADWMTSPLTNIDKINRRLDMVEFLGNDSHLMNDIDVYLAECRDAQRAVQKLSLGQIDPQDLVAIRITLEALQKIKDRMTDKIMLVTPQKVSRSKDSKAIPSLAQETVDNIQGLEHICALIRNVVDESMEQDQEYGFINESVSPILNDMHTKLRELKGQRKTLLDRWTMHLGGVKPFEIKSSFGYRHIVELRSTITAERLRELLNGGVVDVSHADQRRSKVRYQVPELSQLMDSIERMEAQIVQQERSILNATRSEILEESTAIVQNCRYIAQLDVLLAFSKIMLERQYTRPTLNNSTLSLIDSGRHPVVELALQDEGRHFVENSCAVGEEELIWLLTGPNMGGKSTFLRQNAILTIMAQMGSFVPASYAQLGVVDKVFSRLGASDNLANSQSTFMVEMTETASILQNATERSLVIMDEVGRGTATLDGCAIAYATLHHLYNTNRCRTLFATHYHELADMVGAISGSYGAAGRREISDKSAKDRQDVPRISAGGELQTWRGQAPLTHVRCYKTTLEKQDDESYAYIHQVVPGVCRQSHGIHVAKLAGMPASAIDVSTKILEVLQTPNG